MPSGQDVERARTGEAEDTPSIIYWVGLVNLMLVAFGFFTVCYSVHKLGLRQANIESALGRLFGRL